MLLHHHTSGVADYNFDAPSFGQFDPPLSQEEKEEAASIVDGFETTADAQKWGATNPNFQPGRQLSRVDLAVTMLAIQKGLVASAHDLEPGKVYEEPEGENLFRNIFGKGKFPQRERGRSDSRDTDTTRRDTDTPQPEKKPSALPWLLGAGALYLLLKK